VLATLTFQRSCITPSSLQADGMKSGKIQGEMQWKVKVQRIEDPSQRA